MSTSRFEREEIERTTPFPNVLLDNFMPGLTDTEWRLLCVIVRQTRGWRTKFGRKTFDWITHQQFKRRTGRHSAAISQAIASLVRRLVIVAASAEGEVLHSPRARQLYRGRIYYALGPVIHSQTKSGFQKSKETKLDPYKNERPDWRT